MDGKKRRGRMRVAPELLETFLTRFGEAWEGLSAGFPPEAAATPACRALDLARQAFLASLGAAVGATIPRRGSRPGWAGPALPLLADRLPADPPRVVLAVHEESAYLSHYDRHGEIVGTRMVDPLQIQEVLLPNLVSSSGVLPEGAVFYAERGGSRVTGVYAPPQVRECKIFLAQAENGVREVQSFRLPMPPMLVVVGDRRNLFRVFAVKGRPRPGKEDQPLFAFPAFNIFGSHQVCEGSHHFSYVPERMADEFFVSLFNHVATTGVGRSRKHPQDLLAWWREIEGRDEYPLDDLVTARLSLGGLLANL